MVTGLADSWVSGVSVLGKETDVVWSLWQVPAGESQSKPGRRQQDGTPSEKQVLARLSALAEQVTMAQQVGHLKPPV